MGQRGYIAAAIALVALAGCSPGAPAANAVEKRDLPPQAAPATPSTTPGPASPLRDWIVGAWSFDATCSTDFVIHYEADGALDNAGEVGRWALEGDMLTETVTERFENGGEAPVKLDPPTRRTYRVERIDAGHGVITFEKRRVPILRC
ncbi:hypothetical protein ACG3SL_17420 [Sphingomonas sp. CJ20]